MDTAHAETAAPHRTYRLTGDAAALRQLGAQARGLALPYMLRRATQFALETEAFPGLSAWLARLRPAITRETWHTHQDTGNLPAPLRAGCGCVGVLARPLFWLGVARAVPTVTVTGQATPALAAQLARWPGPFPAPQELHLTQTGQPLWDEWDYGDSWEIRLTAAEFDELHTQLRAALGPRLTLAADGMGAHR